MPFVFPIPRSCAVFASPAQAELNESGAITFRYLNLMNPPESPFVGLVWTGKQKLSIPVTRNGTQVRLFPRPPSLSRCRGLQGCESCLDGGCLWCGSTGSCLDQPDEVDWGWSPQSEHCDVPDVYVLGVNETSQGVCRGDLRAGLQKWNAPPTNGDGFAGAGYEQRLRYGAVAEFEVSSPLLCPKDRCPRAVHPPSGPRLKGRQACV